MVDKLLRILAIETKPEKHRTKDEIEEYYSLLGDIQAGFQELYDAKCAPLVDNIRQGLPDGFQKYWDILNDDSTKPPDLPNNITTDYINAVAIPGFFKAQSTIMGILELLQSRKVRWNKIMREVEDTFKAVFPHDKQWRVDAVMKTAIAPEVHSNMFELEELL